MLRNVDDQFVLREYLDPAGDPSAYPQYRVLLEKIRSPHLDARFLNGRAGQRRQWLPGLQALNSSKLVTGSSMPDALHHENRFPDFSFVHLLGKYPSSKGNMRTCESW